jgi:hypothetical protein
VLVTSGCMSWPLRCPGWAGVAGPEAAAVVGLHVMVLLLLVVVVVAARG